MSEDVLSYADARLQRLLEVARERGRLEELNALSVEHTPFLVPHALSGDVLRLLMSHGYRVSNSRELHGFKVERHPPENTA